MRKKIHIKAGVGVMSQVNRGKNFASNRKRAKAESRRRRIEGWQPDVSDPYSGFK